MSTRCQVQICGSIPTIVDGKLSDAPRTFTLYHHCDGYPAFMLPVLVRAWDLVRERWEARRAEGWGYGQYNEGFELGRVQKVAAMVCAADPSGFECLPYNDLHGDIEFLYAVTPEFIRPEERPEPDNAKGRGYYRWLIQAHAMNWTKSGGNRVGRRVARFYADAGLPAIQGWKYLNPTPLRPAEAP